MSAVATLVVPPAPDAGQTDDAARPDGLDRIGDDLPDTRAFDDDVRLESDIRDAPGVVAPRARTSAGLGPDATRSRTWMSSPRCLPMRAAEADRPRTRHEHRPGLPEGTLADRDDLLPLS